MPLSFRFVVVFVLVLVVRGTEGYKSFQQNIPNGDVIPHPCVPGEMWVGVGHQNRNGGGWRNPFGQDFDNNGKVWNRTLCMLDSDGDGKTNGQELGDPDCTWFPGQAPTTSKGLSHPGVCDPVNTALCGPNPDWLICETDDFVCDIINEEDTFNQTVRFPSTLVPEKETTYLCMLFEFPQDGDYHMVATKPEIDNANVMHHILLYGCSDDGDLSNPYNTPFDCGMNADAKCNDIIGIWTVGVNGECTHPNSGFRIGTRGYKRAAVELHWNNPMNINDYKDSSGMTLYFTPNLRINDAGVLTLGQRYLEIPGGQDRHEEKGTSPSECMSTRVTAAVYVTVALNHMHYLGIQQTTQIHRNGTTIDLAIDQHYSYDSPVTYKYSDPIMLLPGDELTTTCVYKSTSQDHVTYFGDATSAEMCFAFLTFYPRQNIPYPSFTAYRGISNCEQWGFYTGDVVRDCNTGNFLNASHPETIALTAVLQKYCSTHGVCLESCLPVVREAKKHPCLHGDVDIWMRNRGNDRSSENQVEAMRFYNRLDSCNAELAREAARGQDFIANAAALPVFPATLLMTALLSIFM